MARAKRKQQIEIEGEGARAIARPAAVGADASAEAGESPARALQQRLADGYRLDEGDEAGRRWSPRATLTLAGGVSLLIWGAVALALSALR